MSGADDEPNGSERDADATSDDATDTSYRSSDTGGGEDGGPSGGGQPGDGPPRGGPPGGGQPGDGPDDGEPDDGGREPRRGKGAPDLSEVAREVGQLRESIEELDDRTVEKPTLEAELKRYVRQRMRRNKARGWGPYLVLLYGTVMVVAAFRYLDGWFAIGAMIILFLSTLGLYTLFVLVGVGLNLLSLPGRALDAVRRRR